MFDTIFNPTALANEEALDGTNPLRHLMEDQQPEPLPTNAPSSRYELLSALPKQSYTVEDGILQLTFQHGHPTIKQPILATLTVDASPGCGGVAWPAGQILASYLVQQGPEYLKNKNILELGSGTGLVGLVAALLGGKVCITDQVPLLDVMRRNVSINNLSSSVTVAELNWGSPIPKGIPRPDLILAADCVYFEPAFPLLVKTLSDLAPDAATEILFCYKRRRKADKRFFGKLKKNFSWKEVDDDPNQAIYNRESITLLRLTKLLKVQLA
ncbi:putative methyltransferase-domain-containing protein [Crucibulum laeve]|uniref:Protein-lysine N-methyltransferase EFM6 n=1 Tax=Crucibulum laeve TaxID=68775 RepID=A0A5C3MFQ4_9AGAR|nr:putative methyltransferase-domain-containing protein [Crucibulum laeve]